jgi:hypothetical protein
VPTKDKDWSLMRTHLYVAALSLLTLAAGASRSAQAQHKNLTVTVRYEDPIRNAHYPELVYWFVTPQTLAPAQYTRDIQHLAHDTVFDFPFLTSREGVSFFDTPGIHDTIAAMVKQAHQNGLRVGMTIHIQDIDSLRKFSYEDEQTVVSDGESVLDAEGRGVVESSIKLRSAPAQKTEVLRVFAFRKTTDGEYDPATLTDVTDRVAAQSPTPGTISMKLDLGPHFAGYTAFCMATTWVRALDLFSDAYMRWVHEAIDQYRDVPLDGTALDEFSYTKVPMTPTAPYRGQFAGHAFAAQFEKTTGKPLTQALFETRYAPAGHPEVRIRAMDEYWDFQRKGPLTIEQEFYNYSREIFGDNNFAGIHNTFHNHLTNDEAWATGINWWTIPRQYGMSDEDLSLPLRMGLLVSHPGNIMYDQFYGYDLHRFAVKAMNDARFNARLHYHGYNDTGRWGTDLSKPPFLTQQNPIERKIRLLNQFDPAAPELPLLVVFGMPSLLNWYPNEAARNLFDVNGSLHIEEKVQAIWDAGYRCAVVPSDLIDNGSLKLDASNHPTLNGHTFRAVVYLYPEYAKRSTLAFLDRFTQHGGALMLEGSATRDFDGRPIEAAFARIAARARVRGSDIDKIAMLGVKKSPLRDSGGELEDGSIILTDLASLEKNEPKSFAIEVNGHIFSGDYIGVFALRAARDGSIEKFACGGCISLARDGHTILHLQSRADLVLRRSEQSNMDVVIGGADGSNAITVTR